MLIRKLGRRLRFFNVVLTGKVCFHQYQKKASELRKKENKNKVGKRGFSSKCQINCWRHRILVLSSIQQLAQVSPLRATASSLNTFNFFRWAALSYCSRTCFWPKNDAPTRKGQSRSLSLFYPTTSLPISLFIPSSGEKYQK